MDLGMDWFERLTGFRESTYEETRRRLVVEGDRLRSLVNGRSYGIGQLDFASLQELRAQGSDGISRGSRLRFRNITADVRDLLKSPEYDGAVFQVASQFNLLEMIGPGKTPLDGVTIYHKDGTQGPACAMAAGAATLYRNYFVPVEGEIGQTADRQLDGLADLGGALSTALNRPVPHLWTMKNGYAFCSEDGLAAIEGHLGSVPAEDRERLKGLLRIGVHRDVEITSGRFDKPQVVTQVFCSALPVGYSPIEAERWQAFATLVLEAAYEATLWAGVLNARRGGSNKVLLTRIGGGVFKNRAEWIDNAISLALDNFRDSGLLVYLVNRYSPLESMRALEDSLAER